MCKNYGPGMCSDSVDGKTLAYHVSDPGSIPVLYFYEFNSARLFEN